VDLLLPRLFEKEYRDLEGSIKLRNYSPKTLAAYRLWVGKFQAFVHSRPTDQLGDDEVRSFLTELAVRHGVAASTQNQAFNALLFIFRHVLRREFGQLANVVRAKRHRYVPVVLSHRETEAVLGELQPPYRLAGLLLYGCGLRLAECVNLDSMLLTVHDGKGQKDRTVPLPARALPAIREQMDFVLDQHAPSVPRGEGKRFQYFTQSKSSPGRVCTVPTLSMHWVVRLPQSPIANTVSLSISDHCAIHVRPPPDHLQTTSRPPRECRKQNEECRMAGLVIYEPCAWEEVATHKPVTSQEPAG